MVEIVMVEPNDKSGIDAVTSRDRTVGIQEFLDAIKDSGLSLSVDPVETSGFSALQLARTLVKQGELTRWQAQQLLNGNRRLCLGKFRLLEKLGEGGMGVVYKAYQPGLNRTVALKVVPQAIAADPSLLRRFFREAVALAALNHPNIAIAHDVACVDETHFLVLEYIEGRDISHWVKQHGRLPVGWSCECIRQAALGLEHAHQQGLIHRDIKPGNLLAIGTLEAPPLVKILDLGLVRFAKTGRGEATELTETCEVLGTPDYMAPEQALSTKKVDIRADIYSLGCTLYNMLTAAVPFAGDTALEVMVSRASNDPPHVRDMREDVPVELDTVIHKMMAREAEDRYQTPSEVAEAMVAFAMSEAEPAGIAAPDDASSSGGWSRRAIGFTFAATLLLGAGLGAALYVMRASPATGTLHDIARAKSNFKNTTVRPTLSATSEAPSPENPPKEDPSTDIPPGGLPARPNNAMLPYGRLVETLSPTFRSTDMDLSEDGRLLAYGSPDGTVVLYDLERRNSVAVLKEHVKDVNCVVFTPDEQSLMTAGKDKAIRVWDVATGKLKAIWQGHEEWIRDGLFLPDRETFIACDMQGQIRFWKDGEETRPPIYAGDRLLDLDLSSDGRLIAGAKLYGNVRIWDAQTYEVVIEINAFNDRCGAVNFSPDNLTLVSCNNLSARLFDVESGEQIFEVEDQEVPIKSAWFAPTGELMMTRGHAIDVWDPVTRQWLGTLPGDNTRVGSFVFSADRMMMIAGSRVYSSYQPDENVRMSEVHKYGGQYYRIFWQEVSWSEARRLCQLQGGTLASFEDRDECDNLMQFKGPRKLLWIGGHKIAKDEWKWLDGRGILESGLSINDIDATKDRHLVMSGVNSLAARPEDGKTPQMQIRQVQGYLCEWDYQPPP